MANPSSPSTSRAVTTGKWLTPATVGRTASCGLAQGDGQVHGPVADLVAQADRLDRGLPAHGPGQAGHRVGDVEQPGVRAHLPMSSPTADQHRDVAQGPVDPAGADGVAHRLADAVAGRHVEVDGHGVEPAGGDGHDHEVGAVEGPALSRWWWRRWPWPPAPRRPSGPAPPSSPGGRGRCPRARGAPAQRRGPEQVGQQLGRPLVAAAADDRDLGHGSLLVSTWAAVYGDQAWAPGWSRSA